MTPAVTKIDKIDHANQSKSNSRIIAMRHLDDSVCYGVTSGEFWIEQNIDKLNTTI